MSDFWTTERIQQLLGESDKWPQLTVEDGGAELYLDGEQSRFSLIDEKGFAYGWIPGERMARLFAAAPEALVWCVGAIATAQLLADSYAKTNEAQRKRIDELLATVAKTNRRAEAAERDCATVMEQRENWRRRTEAAERQTRVPDMVIDGYVNYVNLSKMIGNPVMPFSHWLAEGDKEP